MAILDLDPDQLLTTTRAVRKRLDLTRPVPRELLLECLDVAVQAPSGSNSQTWQWVFVEDPDKKQALEDLYGRSFDPYINAPKPDYGPDDTRTQRAERVRESAIYLREHLHEVPVLLIPCAAGRIPTDAPSVAHASYWGSLLPAVWSFMLAARARGLGTAWTTLHLPFEQEAAELLGIPFDGFTQAGLFPVAYTIGTDFKAAPRLALDGIVHFDRW
ncbi:MAG: nitroreductase family protein [Acidimicrobiales bacterium]